MLFRSQPAAARETTKHETAKEEMRTGKRIIPLKTIRLLSRYRYPQIIRPELQKAITESLSWPAATVAICLQCVDELMNNAFNHGCRGNGKKEVSMVGGMEGPCLTITVGDLGDGFDLDRVLSSARKAGKRASGLLFVRERAVDLVSEIEADRRMVLVRAVFTLESITNAEKPAAAESRRSGRRSRA